MTESLRAKRETLLVVGLLMLGSLFILLPFLDAVIIGAVVAYILSKTHEKLNPHIDNELLSSIIIICSVLATVIIGLYFFINNFFDILAQLNIFTGSLQETVIQALQPLNLPETFLDNIRQYLNEFSNSISDLMIGIFASLPSVIIDLGIFLVTAIYLYKDRERIGSQLHSTLDSLPETEGKITRNIIESTEKIFQGVFLTQTIVALALGIISGIGFYIISALTSPIPLIPLWAFFIVLASLLPLVANFMFYAPLGLYYILMGAEPIKGSLILLFGVVVLQIFPEIFLRPYVGAKRLDEHPLIVFLGFLAGPLVLGFKGLVLGPILLILTKEFALNYSELVSDVENENHSEDTEE